MASIVNPASLVPFFPTPGCIGCHLVGIVAGDLSSAVSLNGVVMNSARVVGPALARVLIVTIGTTSCLAVTAVSYVAVIAALVMLRPLRPGVRGRRAAGGVHAGLRYAASRCGCRSS